MKRLALNRKKMPTEPDKAQFTKTLYYQILPVRKMGNVNYKTIGAHYKNLVDNQKKLSPGLGRLHEPDRKMTILGSDACSSGCNSGFSLDTIYRMTNVVRDSIDNWLISVEKEYNL